ncbi:hypothetical protein QVD17_31356 [Tagetes erecta]|uniref:Uncharacterized protein n=1 Tax=Tagetes erecta TaxID=13708 RepID=A0AAD8K460_TARER|nr:hypothetical protein QVD17_31356 [Tagetes erecta]
MEVWRIEDHEWYPLSSVKSVKQKKIKINRDIKPVEQEENEAKGIMEPIKIEKGDNVESEAGQGYGRGRGRQQSDGPVVGKGFGRAYVIRNRQLKEVQCGVVTGSINVPDVGGALGMYVDGARFARTSRR